MGSNTFSGLSVLEELGVVSLVGVDGSLRWLSIGTSKSTGFGKPLGVSPDPSGSRGVDIEPFAGDAVPDLGLKNPARLFCERPGVGLAEVSLAAIPLDFLAGRAAGAVATIGRFEPEA